jgi:hypothetical protein
MLKHYLAARELFAGTKQAVALLVLALLAFLIAWASLGAVWAVGTALRLVLD